MSTAPQYRAAVLGHTGRGNYGHSLDMAFTGFPNVDIVALADPDPEGRAAAAARCGATRTYADPYELLEQERPNLVAVATSWLDVHQDLWLAAIEVGAHIYSEKPIAKSLEEADRMLAAADAKGVKIAIAHQNRVSPYHVYARKLLHEGAIGRLRLIRGYGKMDTRGGGQDTMVLGTHIFDQMRFMTDADPEWCQARVTQDGRDATAADVQEGAGEIGLIAGNGLWAAYGFPNGVIATYESYAGTNFADDEGSPAFGFDICGSEGILSLRVRTLHRYPRPYSGPLVDESGDARWEQVEVAPLPPPPGAPAGGGGQLTGNHYIVRDLLAAIAEDRKPLSSSHDGRWSLEMIHAIYDAHRTGGRVPLPLADRAHPLSRW